MNARVVAIAFILKYQDRPIYGTDLAFTADDHVQARMNFGEQTYTRDWRFLATGIRWSRKASRQKVWRSPIPSCASSITTTPSTGFPASCPQRIERCELTAVDCTRSAQKRRRQRPKSLAPQ
jgi:hypothetical protein